MASTSTSLNQPNTTLYLNNLNDKLTSSELRSQLYALFTTHGKIVDIVSSKSKSMRGQAFLVFADLAGATTAMRACEGMAFYDKPIHIDYAKTKSYATLRREDPNFVSPSLLSSSAAAISLQNLYVSDQNKKRPREDSLSGGPNDEPQKKREKQDGDSDDEEMEIEEDEDQKKAAVVPIEMSSSNVPAAQAYPSPRLLCTNLPQEVTNDVLSVLFQQYRGFISTHVAQSPTPQIKMAQVIFESAELATVAKEALDGFSLKKGWKMGVAYI